jgi:ethanolamine ammonia-lyase small subunit
MGQQPDRVNNFAGYAPRRQVLESYIRVLNNIMQKGRAHRNLVTHLLRQMERMKYVRQTGAVNLTYMRVKGDS